MTLLEKYIDCMQKGDAVELANLFDDYGVLHDSSTRMAGMDTRHLEGKMAVEMMFHNRFGFNGGPFKITSVSYQNETTVCYFITYGHTVVPVMAVLSLITSEDKIKRLNIYPL